MNCDVCDICNEEYHADYVFSCGKNDETKACQHCLNDSVECAECKEPIWDGQDYRNYDSEPEKYYHYECTREASRE